MIGFIGLCLNFLGSIFLLIAAVKAQDNNKGTLILNPGTGKKEKTFRSIGPWFLFLGFLLQAIERVVLFIK